MVEGCPALLSPVHLVSIYQVFSDAQLVLKAFTRWVQWVHVCNPRDSDRKVTNLRPGKLNIEPASKQKPTQAKQLLIAYHLH